MNTLPKGYLFSVKNNKVVIIDKLFVPCNRYHPDTSRFVILLESPCQENNFKSASVMVRYINGKYYGVTTGYELPVILDKTVWTESSIAEGPYYVCDSYSWEKCPDKKFENYKDAAVFVNELNMVSLGSFPERSFTVINKYNIPVNSNGHLYI